MKEELSNNLQKDCYECIICNCKIFSYTNFILHHKIHAIRIFFDDWKISYKQINNCYKCNYCSMLISRKINLLKHLTKHFNGEYHNCNNCERIFIGKDNLDIHLKTKHQQNNDEVKNNHNHKQMLDQDSGSSSSSVDANKSQSFDNDGDCQSSQITKSTDILSKKLTKKLIVSIKRSKKIDRMALEKKYKNVKHEFEPTSAKIRTKTIAKIMNENYVKTEKELCENYEKIKTSKKKSRKKLIVKLEVIDIDSKIKEHPIKYELKNLENYKYKSKNESEEITEEFNKNDTNIDTLKGNIERKTVIVNANFEKVNIQNINEIQTLSNKNTDKVENDTENQILNDNDDDGTQHLCDRNSNFEEVNIQNTNETQTLSNKNTDKVENDTENQILNDNDDDGTQHLCDKNENSIVSNEKEQEIQNQKTQIKNSLKVRNVEKINEMLIEKTNDIYLENEVISDKNVMKSPQISNNIQNFDESDKMNNETNHILKHVVNNNEKTDKIFNDYQNRTNKEQFGSNVIKFNYSIKNVENENSNMKSLENNQMKSNENINSNIIDFNLIDSSNSQNSNYNESATNNYENDIVNKIFNFRRFSEKFQNINVNNQQKQLKRKEITDLYCEENEIQLSEENLNQQKRIKVDNRNNYNQIAVIKKANTPVISSTTTSNSEEFSTTFSSLKNIIRELQKNNTNLSMEIASTSITPVINLIDDDDDFDNSNTTSTCEISIGNRERNTEIIDLTLDGDYEARNRNDLTSNIVYAAEKRIDLTSNVNHEPKNITISHMNVDNDVEKKGILQELEHFLQSFENMLYTNNIPISLEDIIFLEKYYYVKEISSYDFSEEQLKVIRSIRKRTRNAIKNYRKKNEDFSISATSNNYPESNPNLFTINEKLNADTYQQQPQQQQPIHQQGLLLPQQPLHQQPLHQLPLHQQPLHQQPQQQQPTYQQPLHQQPLHQLPLHQQPPHQHPLDQQRQLLLQQPLDQQRQLSPENTWSPLSNIYPVTISFQHPQSGAEVTQQIPFTINPNCSNNSTINLTQNHPVLSSVELANKFDPANKLAVFNNLSNLNVQNTNEMNGEKYDIENRLMQIVLDPNSTISHEPSKNTEYYVLSPNLKIRMTP